MQSASGSYARTGSVVNCARALRTLEAIFFVVPRTCEEMDKRERAPAAPGSARLGSRQWPVLGLELPLDAREHVEGAVQGGRVVRGHHARAQHRAPRWH